jgi:hypothetical protein
MKPRYVDIGRPSGGPHQAAEAQALTQGEITMPIPQFNDRIKEAPAVMLRAVFAGVGQLLLAADKVRARAAEAGWPPDRTTPKGQPQGWSRWHTLDDTRSGTVPLAREQANSHDHSARRSSANGDSTVIAASAGTEAAHASAGPEAASVPAASAGAERPARPAAAAARPAAPAGPTADAPPLPGYDDLSLPSLRARMRALDAATLRALLAYERAHAHRDNVIAMFERRLAKIDAG